MKKLTWITLFVCGLTVLVPAQTNSKNGEISNNTEAAVPENTIQASVSETKTEVSTHAVSNLKQKKEKASMMKKWKDRSIVGKVLIIGGVAVFVVLCVMFGTVSVG